MTMTPLHALLLATLLWASAATAAGPDDAPDAAVAALWNALSNEPGAAADVAALRRLFHADAVVFGGRYDKGAPSLTRSSAADFIARQGKASAAGFYECEVSRKVERYDRFAAVVSVVESRSDKAAAKPDFVGINSIQLYREGGAWWIVALYYHVENPAAPLAYAPNAERRCLN
jgi:hypothetical protein